jgi:hypothetical protein
MKDELDEVRVCVWLVWTREKYSRYVEADNSSDAIRIFNILKNPWVAVHARPMINLNRNTINIRETRRPQEEIT